MIVLVCGGRDFTDFRWLFDVLDGIDGITKIVNGGARGADYHASEWAAYRGVDCKVYKADWDKHKNRAGPIRNQQMIDEEEIDLVVAMPGGRGTKDMITRAVRHGIKVHKETRDGVWTYVPKRVR